VTLRFTPQQIVDKLVAEGRAGALASTPEWSRVRLGDIASVINGAPYKSSLFNTDGDGMPLIRIRDVGADRPSTWYSGDWEKAHLVQHGDLLVGMDGDFRAAHWRSEDALLNQRVCRLHLTGTTMDARFFFHALQPYLDAIWATTSSTTVKHLSSRSIADIPLPCPSLGEQRRIVAVLEDHLSRLDAADAYLLTASRRLSALQRAAVDDVMLREAENGHWPMMTVSDFAADMPRAMTDGPFGSSLARHHYTASGARVVRLQNIGDGFYKEVDAFVSEEHYARLAKHDVRGGDVVVASLGEQLPRAAIVPGHVSPAIVKADCIRLRTANEMHAEWVVRATQSSRSKAWAKARLHGVGRQRLGMTGIREIPVPRPPDEQSMRAALARIRRRTEQAQQLVAGIGDSQRRTAALRRALLTAAFTGRLTGRSSDMDIAEELAEVVP